MSLVIDCSVAVAWLMPDEAAPLADHAMALVVREGADVPTLFLSEVGNVLLANVRRRRIPLPIVFQGLADLTSLLFRPDGVAVSERIAETARIAQRYGLTVYDATYLELALRLSAPLATLDAPLAKAARTAGVRLFDD